MKRLRLAMRQERTIRLLTLYRLKHRLGILWQMTTTHLRVVHLPPAAQPSGSLPVWERPTTALEAAPQGTESVDTPPPPVSPGASATTPMPTNTPIWEAATTYLAVPPDAPPKPDAGAPAAQSNRAPIGQPHTRTTGGPHREEHRQRVWEMLPTAPLRPTPSDLANPANTAAQVEEQATRLMPSAQSFAPPFGDGMLADAPSGIHESSAALPALRMTPVRVSPVLRDPRRTGRPASLWDRETQELPIVRRPGRPDNVFALQAPSPQTSTRLLVISTTTRAVRPQSQSARLKSLAWLALRIALSVGLLAYLVIKTNIHALVSVIAQANPVWLALGLGVGVITVVVSAWQWQILLRGERISLDLLSLTWLYFLGIAFNQLLPSSIGGDVAKIAYVARISRKGVSAASATVMTRIVGLGAMLLTALPVAVGAPLLIANFGRVGWGMAALMAVALLAYTAGVSVLLSTPWLLSRLGVERAVRLPYARKAMDLARSLTAYRHRKSVLLSAFFASAVFYAASDLNFYCYGQALGIHSPFWFYWITIPLTSLATLAPISLNGYGVRGASFVALFVLVGESGAAALSLSTTMEVQMLLFAVVGAVVAVALQRRGSLIREAPETTPFSESRLRADEPVAAFIAPAGAGGAGAPVVATSKATQGVSVPSRRPLSVVAPDGSLHGSLADRPTARLASAGTVEASASEPGTLLPTTRRSTGWPTPLPPTLEPVDADGWSSTPGDVAPTRDTATPIERRGRDGKGEPIGSRASPLAELPTAPQLADLADEATADEQPTRLGRPTGRPQRRNTAY